jgi:hypothetical protein
MLSENAAQFRQLAGVTKSNLKELKRTKQHTESWDAMIMYILGQRLDNKTKRKWELQTSDTQFHILQQLYTFLEQRCNALEGLQRKPMAHEQRHETAKQTAHKGHAQSYVSVKKQCILCKDTHFIQHCSKCKQVQNDEQ